MPPLTSDVESTQSSRGWTARREDRDGAVVPFLFLQYHNHTERTTVYENLVAVCVPFHLLEPRVGRASAPTPHNTPPQAVGESPT